MTISTHVSFCLNIVKAKSEIALNKKCKASIILVPETLENILQNINSRNIYLKMFCLL